MTPSSGMATAGASRQAPPASGNLGFFAGLRLALRLARRELRGGVRGFGVFLTCLALGVGTVTAVGVFSAAVDDGLAHDARRLLGGDVQFSRTYVQPGPEALALASARGELSHFARMRTMVRPASGGPPVLASLKAVDRAYPLVGELELESGQGLSEALAGQNGLPGAVVERELLLRLNARTGDVLAVGQARFVITDLIRKEPDRVSQFFGLGPRVMISLDSLADTGLIRPGGLASFGVNVRLPPGAGVGGAEALEEELRAGFPDQGLRVQTYRNPRGGLTWLLDSLETDLTLVGLAALLIGGIGVAGAVRSFLAGRGASVAVMKSLGASGRLVIGIYLLQTMGLALAGSLGGAAAGVLVAALGAGPLAARIGVPLGHGLYWAPVLLGVAYGLLIALIFAVWPLSAVGRIRPARLFRGYADPGVRRPGAWAVAVCLGAVGVLLGLLLLTSPSPSLPLGFVAACAVSLGLFWVYAWGIRVLAARLPRVGPPHLRQALAGLHRPGSSTGSVLFSLGLGLTVLVVVLLADGNIQDLILRQTPATAPSFFFIDVPKERMADLERTALAVSGVGHVDKTPSIRGRILEINGVPAHEVEVGKGSSWALRSDRALTFAGPMPDRVKLVTGQWWAKDYAGPPLICLDSDIARDFGVGVGGTLTVNVLGRSVTGTIAATREIDYTTGGINHAITFSPGVLEGAPYTWIATAYAERGAEETLFREITGRFPEVIAISMREVLEEIAAIVADIGLAVRSCAAVTLLAGLLVLAEALRANLRTRHRDAVIFKVLGATRRDVMLALVLEFAMLGAAAALLAAALGTVGGWLFVTRVLDGKWVFLPWTLAGVVLGGVAATVTLGVLGVRKALSRSAWPVLRNE